MNDPAPPLAAPRRVSTTPDARRRGCRRGRGVLSTAALGLTSAGLLALTAWNVTRSDALGDAEAAYRRDDFATGLRRALDHLDRRPWSRRAARVAALCLSRLDFAGTAEPYYRRAGRLGLDDLHTRAYGLVRGNRRHQAEAAYRQILGLRPDDPLALRRLGAELMTMMRWGEALELAERLARTPGGEVDGLAMIGAIQHHDNKAAAAAAYVRILAIDPGLRRLPSLPAFRQVFWTQLTEDLLAIGRPVEARRHLQTAPPGDRGPTWAWLLGRTYHQEGAFDEADRCWREAVQGDPGLAVAWADLGGLALARNRPEEALAPLERAAALEPHALAPAYQLAVTYRRLGQTDRAERYRERAERLRREPSRPSAAGARSDPPPRPVSPKTS